MNSINVTVYNPGFMLAFMGTGAICLVLAVGSYFWWPSLDGKLLLAAALLHIVGSIGVTMLGNVPLNDALAAFQPGEAGAGDIWQRFLRDGSLWNHVRTAASLCSAVVFLIALIERVKA